MDGHFAYFEKVKIDPTDLFLLLWAGHSYFTKFGLDVRP